MERSIRNQSRKKLSIFSKEKCAAVLVPVVLNLLRFLHCAFISLSRFLVIARRKKRFEIDRFDLVSSRSNATLRCSV